MAIQVGGMDHSWLEVNSSIWTTRPKGHYFLVSTVIIQVWFAELSLNVECVATELLITQMLPNSDLICAADYAPDND